MVETPTEHFVRKEGILERGLELAYYYHTRQYSFSEKRGNPRKGIDWDNDGR